MPADNKWINRLRRIFGSGAALRQEDLALHRLLFLLLPALENLGMTLSPDRYLRLKRLLNAVPAGQPLAAWRLYLCPVFATDENGQRAFNELFDRLLEQTRAESTALPSKNEEKEKKAGSTSSVPPPADPPQPAKPTRPAGSAPAGPARRPLVVELDECIAPPYSWNIVPDPAGVPVDTGPTFGKTALRLRRRESAEHARPDLPASVRATIAAGGVPVFRYRLATRPAEYLLLVERHALDDHRAALFDFFYRSLRGNEVLIERFFYQGDLRACRNERFPAGLDLRQLRYRYPDARLVVMGSGYRLLSPKTGEPAPWMQPLSGWTRRVLLTPVPRRDWGQRERALETLFTLLPASLQSLHYLSGADDDTLPGRYDALPEYVRRIAEVQPLEISQPVMAALRRHYDPGTLCWIAACAVYPALHFELTLRLGRLLSGSLGYNLVSAANLLALARLPWFTAGHLPAPVRTELLDYLEHRHPQQHRLVLDFLYELLEDQQDQVPVNSAAWAEHQINLALLRALRDPQPDPETAQQLRAVVKRLDRPEKHGDFVLPASWETLLEKIGWEEPSLYKVLVIDPDEDWQRHFQRAPILRDHYSFYAARSEDAALRMLTDNIGYDLVLLEVHLNTDSNEKTGLPLLSTIRSGYPSIPVIVVTFDSSAAIKAIQLAVSYYLLKKDFDAKEWDEVFRETIERQRQKNEETEGNSDRPLQGAKIKDPFLSGSGHAPEMVFVAGGEFLMGSDDPEAYDDEKPVHPVRVGDFYIGKYPVTVADFKIFADETNYETDAEKSGSSNIWQGTKWEQKKGVNWRHDVKGDLRPPGEAFHPVIHISWNDATAYCQWLSQKTGRSYRLPAEAEWEFAARGGVSSQGTRYAGSDNLDEVAWYSENSKSKTHPVGGKKPNELGLHDMSGNVWEWCEDDWHGNYKGAPADGSAWIDSPERGDGRVYRGGSWSGDAQFCRVACRNFNAPALRSNHLGFRLVFSPS